MLSSQHPGNILWASVSKLSTKFSTYRFKKSVDRAFSRWILLGFRNCLISEVMLCCYQSRIAQYAFTGDKGLSAQLWESVLSSQAEITSSLPGEYKSSHEASSTGKVIWMPQGYGIWAGHSVLSKRTSEQQNLETAVFVNRTNYLDSSHLSITY